MIVDRLSKGERSAGELTKAMGSGQSTVQAAGVLHAHGIVVDGREGDAVMCRPLIPCVWSLFAAATKVIGERRRDAGDVLADLSGRRGRAVF